MILSVDTDIREQKNIHAVYKHTFFSRDPTNMIIKHENSKFNCEFNNCNRLLIKKKNRTKIMHISNLN